MGGCYHSELVSHIVCVCVCVGCLFVCRVGDVWLWVGCGAGGVFE